MGYKLGVMANFMCRCTGQILRHYSGCVCESVLERLTFEFVGEASRMSF